MASPGEGAGPAATTSALISDISSILRGNIKFPFSLSRKERKKIKFEIDNSWESEINQFLDSIENQVPIKVGSSKDALAVMQLIDKTYKNGD